VTVDVSLNVNQKFFSVAKIAELLQSPQRHSRVTIQNQEMIFHKEMFLGVDRKQVGMEMIECQMAVSSIGMMQLRCVLKLLRRYQQRLSSSTSCRDHSSTDFNGL